MSGSKHISAAEQARETYRQNRIERSRTRKSAYEPPLLKNAIPPIAGDDRTLWPEANRDTDLEVAIPAPPELPTEGDELNLFVTGIRVESREIRNPSDPEERNFTVAADTFGDQASYDIHYSFKSILDGNEIHSEPALLTVDRVPPNEGRPVTTLLLPEDIVDNELRRDYLESHETLDITVPRSSDMIAGDTIYVFWGRIKAIPDGPTAIKVVSEEDVANTGSLVLSIDSADIERLPQDEIGISYRYVDRSGNLGQMSMPVELYVDLDPLPSGLEDPVVPLAGDGLIDRADAQEGVTVVIPGYVNFKLEDRIQVTWEDELIEPFPVTELPMDIPITWSALSAGGDHTARDFKVKYSVLRKKFRADSAEIDVSVDFTVAGIDPPPENPGPVNPYLPRVVIKSREGSPEDNVLGEADKNMDARAEIPSNPAVRGDKLRLYWGAVESFVDEVEISDEEAGDPITFNVPWAKIVEGGYSDKLPVYYSTWNNVNEQESERTSVDVRIIDIVGLNEVEFPDRWRGGKPDAIPMINCCSLPWNGVRFRVLPDPDNFSDGDTLDIQWQGYSDIDFKNPISGSDYSFETITLDDEKIKEGFEKTVPYDDYVEPILFGSAIVTCTLTKSASGQSGSSATQVRVSRRGAGAVYCTIDSELSCPPSGRR